MTPDREEIRALEVAARRPLAPGVAHPDRCAKLTLHGVPFAIPPRGLRVVPVFDTGETSVRLEGMEACPAADALLAAAPPLDEQPRCACGRAEPPPAAVDIDDVQFLAAAFDLAATLLDCQYVLTDEQKARLLAFEPDRPPRWIGQLLRWCAGLPAEETRP